MLLRDKDAEKGSPMRVVHINTQDMEGGAANVATCLADMQRAQGHDAVLLVGQKKLPGKRSVRFDMAPDRASAPLFVQELRQSFYFLGSHALVEHPLVRDADIVHLHNVHFGYFNPLSLAALSRTKPTVWTLHDMWALTGLCGHSFACGKWADGCHDCLRTVIDCDNHDPALTTPWKQRAIEDNYRLKSLIYEHSVLTVTAPSSWLGNKARAGILAGHPVHVVHNGVDTAVFQPGDKTRARARFGIPANAFVMGAAAVSGVLQHPLKGGDHIRRVVARVREAIPHAVFVNIGAFGPSDLPGIINVPYLAAAADVAEAYAALDIFLFASMAETFSLTTAEAMACGLPVVSFATGPLPDLVTNGGEGRLAPYGDDAALAEAVIALATDTDALETMGKMARRKVVSRFTLAGMADVFGKVYEEALQTFACRRAASSPLPLGALPAPMVTLELARAECLAEIDAAVDKEDALARYLAAQLPQVRRLLAMTGEERVLHYLRQKAGDDPQEFYARQYTRATQHAQAVGLAEVGRHAEAAEAYARLASAYPHDLALVREEGRALWLAGDRDAAMERFMRYLNVNPPRLDVWLLISELLQRDGDLDQAMAVLAHVRGKDPFHVRLHRREGDIFYQRGAYRKAAKAFAAEYRMHGGDDLPGRIRELLVRMNKPGLAALFFRTAPARGGTKS